MNVIETEGLTKYYGNSRGIVDVTLSIKEGDLFGFIGPNGAGKSTLIRTLLGLISPTSGSATVFGKDIKSVYAFCPDETKNRVSVIVSYDTFDVTVEFVDCYHYAATVICKEGVLSSAAGDASYCYERELDEFFQMMKEKRMEQDYAEYKKPVTLLHCIQESYQQKKAVEVKW